MNIFEIVLLQPLASGLIIFYKMLGQNMGLAIIAFSIFLRFVLNPLTKPYMDSMKKIREVAPQLEKLKLKYKDDKMKLAQAQADFYKEKGINPGAGCLPYLLQIVILIAFFNVFSKTLSAQGNLVDNFNKLLYDFLKFKDGDSIGTSFLYLNVTKPDAFLMPYINIMFPGPMLILSALAQFVSAKIMTPLTQAESSVADTTKGSSDDMQVAMQKSMSYTFPLFTLLIGMKFASGLALYWLIFSLMQIQQQVSSQGWGGMTPLINKIKLLKSGTRS
jgi:YidC/Oxa1 family membrane protein insertase